MGTFIVGVIVLGIVAAIIYGIVHDKKSGKTTSCGGDCGHCSGCH